jgi:hypothetical protein
LQVMCQPSRWHTLCKRSFFSSCAPDHIAERSLSPQPLTWGCDRVIVILSRLVGSHHGRLLQTAIDKGRKP